MLTQLHAWIALHSANVTRAGLLLAVGLLLATLLRRTLRRALLPRCGLQHALLAGNIVRNTIVAVTLLSVLWELGFKLNALLTAAGVVGVALGFAAQTSLSNLISGLFLLSERSLRIGDTVEIDTVTGVVHNVGLLATYVRTFDNRLVRFPNEMLIKSRVTNLTRFPIRRLDIPIGVGYREDVDRVSALLLALANATPLCLDEPAPQVLFRGFGESSLDFTLAVWFEQPDLLALRSALLRDIKVRFDQEGIAFPYPHITLQTADATAPAPPRVVPSGVQNGVAPATQLSV